MRNTRTYPYGDVINKPRRNRSRHITSEILVLYFNYKAW